MKNIQELLTIAKKRGIKLSFLNELIGGYRGKLTDAKKGKTTLSDNELLIIEHYLNVEPRASYDDVNIKAKKILHSNINSPNAKTNILELTEEERQILEIYRKLALKDKAKFILEVDKFDKK